ncbi:sigma 54-interacting transcriptional regulator [Sandaracinus amylolyticus]|uniref:sigma 54-interacting transcriptional regulator n=1 Tax=Sandaracinus amylolyticus TaxID=927083 RepID=UPI001F1867C1|nr:sigma 54-interacting transcriptional regulator [Sandaracinus amylolyticus]UJR84978.1 Hypothetical protein I5071_70570 [Sandaracinus amylolyticus]
MREATTWDAPSATSITRDQTACVVVTAGPARGVHDLPRDAELAIGRSRSSAIAIDDPAVSRLHATLRWDGGEHAMLVDHGSRNGSLVDGIRVSGEVAVRSGSEIAIGPARLVVVLPRASAPGEIDAPGDPAMRRVEVLARRASACDLPVLIVGETGAGKEVLARRVHERSGRARKAFVAVNCGSIPETLAEATLFGHEKGAFTGAHARREGVFEAASGGTLFLDEIGELSLAMQVRLLRALEERVVTRVGGTAPVAVDVRVIAATNRDLDAMAKQGLFRRDLLYRLDVLRIAIPPLRERPDDVIALATEHLREIAEDVRLAPDAIALLRGYAWPGNVRELRNAIARAVALRDSEVLSARDFATLLERERGVVGAGAGILRGRVDDAERQAIEDALAACGGNQTRAAARLGISRRALIYKLEKHGLKAPPRA